jgi:hypothetical protein
MSGLAYLNFDLLIESVGETRYRARVNDSPSGDAARSEFTLAFSPDELETLMARAGRLRGHKRDVIVDRPAQSFWVQEFGQRLFAAVFGNEIHMSLQRSVDEAKRQQSGLRIRLILEDAPDLIDLPWEYLYDPVQKRFLARSRHTPLIRYLRLSQPRRPLTVQPPLRILVMISSPKGYPRLDTEREWDKLSGALGRLVEQGQVVLERLESATLWSLREQLSRDKHHVLHFVGHGDFDPAGGGGVLLLEDKGDSAKPVGADLLGTMLYDHDSIRLAVLNACEGARTSSKDPFAGTAQALIGQQIPAVIGMQFPITDDAAIGFTQGLYEALAGGQPVDAALTEGRMAIVAQGNEVEWATPVLYMRSPDGRIFDVASGGGGAPAPSPPSSRQASAEVPPAAPVTDDPRLSLLQRAKRMWALALAETDDARALERKGEAYDLLREAQQADPMNTEVLLLMAELLVELTPDDPQDERKLLRATRRLLEQPKDDPERVRLAQATYRLAASRDPLDWSDRQELVELLEPAERIFQQMGMHDMVGRCRALLSPLDEAEERAGVPEQQATDPGSPPPDVGPPSPASVPAQAPGAFPPTGGPPVGPIRSAVQLAGRWQLRSVLGPTATWELRPDGFQAQVFNFGVMTNYQTGWWNFNPHTQALMLQGTDSVMGFFTAYFTVRGMQGDAYSLIDATGVTYTLTRSQ